MAPGVPEAHQMLPSSVVDKAGTVAAFLDCHQQLLLCSPSSRSGMASKSSLHMFHCRVLGFCPPLMQNSVETPSCNPISSKGWGGMGRCGLLCGPLGGGSPDSAEGRLFRTSKLPLPQWVCFTSQVPHRRPKWERQPPFVS